MKKVGILIALLLIMTMCACGEQNPENITATTVYIKDDGSIEATFVEDFSMPQYDKDELQAMAEEEMLSYNTQAGEDKVAMPYFKVEGNIAKMQMTFEDAATYREFNRELIFVGTVAEALEEGYDLKFNLVNPSDSEDTIGEYELLTMQDANIVIVGDAVRVRVESKILYMSADAKYIDEYEVDGYDNPDATVIIY